MFTGGKGAAEQKDKNIMVTINAVKHNIALAAMRK